MAEADMADRRRIDQRRDGLLQLGKRGAKPRMVQQGLVVANEEMVEGEIELNRGAKMLMRNMSGATSSTRAMFRLPMATPP